jgi:hypothetical protein
VEQIAEVRMADEAAFRGDPGQGICQAVQMGSAISWGFKEQLIL